MTGDLSLHVTLQFGQIAAVVVPLLLTRRASAWWWLVVIYARAKIFRVADFAVW